MSVFPLQACTQSYDWGKLGTTSKVAQYAKMADPSFHLDEARPYAEASLWMGTHPNAPSRSLEGQPLPQILAENQGLLGSKRHKDLPFLFKVLAIRKALSIQSHPDKQLAERLHKEQPNVYKDPNHKPEMAIAITPFTALCGFQPPDNLVQNLLTVPELGVLIPQPLIEEFVAAREALTRNSSEQTKAVLRESLQKVFEALMTANPETVATQAAALLARLSNTPESPTTNLVQTLYSQFPNDIGIFCVYFLNLLTLQPGEAIFLGAGEPHAYISGECVEVMATSDNVLRAGLTPKPRDVKNLVGSLTYSMTSGEKHLVRPIPWGGGGDGDGGGEYDDGRDARGIGKTKLYDPPVEEFSVLHISLRQDETEHHRAIDGPSIVIATRGKGEMVGSGDGVGAFSLKEGSVLFIGAGEEVVWKARGSDGLEVYRAFCE
ncbi:Mannose-6-phosphate isomerase [Serendipita sp. 399]|nr:Mannose-6-phosphate isomerase [Serendipita sp. 399]